MLAPLCTVAEFVILKHVLPYLVNILVPVVVVCTQEDIRMEAEVRGGRWQVQVVYRRPGEEVTEEMTLLQVMVVMMIVMVTVVLMVALAEEGAAGGGRWAGGVGGGGGLEAGATRHSASDHKWISSLY